MPAIENNPFSLQGDRRQASEATATATSLQICSCLAEVRRTFVPDEEEIPVVDVATSISSASHERFTRLERAINMHDMDFQRKILEEALSTLGAVLLQEQAPFELLAIGGSGLLLLGLIERPTGDLDVIALVRNGNFQKLEVLPERLQAAVDQVGRALGLDDRWLNTGPASLMDFGLPEGWENRLATQQYGALCLHLPSREDQICFKLYAAVDRGPDDKHFVDLNALEPTRDELVFAARWTITHDASTDFRQLLKECLMALGVEVSDDELG